MYKANEMLSVDFSVMLLLTVDVSSGGIEFKNEGFSYLHPGSVLSRLERFVALQLP